MSVFDARVFANYVGGLGTSVLGVFVEAAKRNIERARGVNKVEMERAEVRLAVYEKELGTR